MEKILFVHGGLLNFGGTEAVMMNYYRNFNHKKIQVDFILHGFGKGKYDEEVLSLGGKIFNVTPKGKNYFKNKSELKHIMKSDNYIAVHSHMDAANAQVLKLAKKCGIPVRISHSHNTATQTLNPLKKMFNFFEKKKIKKYATKMLACSDLAGKWLYGKENFTVLNNAIDSEKFIFNEQIRQNVREKLGIDNNAVVLGHIGRFSYQKNHEKLISIFETYNKINRNSYLWLIGDGEEKENIKKSVNDKKLLKNVVFIEPNNIVCDYLQGMDCFVMPSRFEGLPVVAVEAQASGLPVVLSDTVSSKTAITNSVSFVALNADDSEWCSAIESALKLKRKNMLNEIKKAGFDIKQNSEFLQNMYIKR